MSAPEPPAWSDSRDQYESRCDWYAAPRPEVSRADLDAVTARGDDLMATVGIQDAGPPSRLFPRYEGYDIKSVD